MSWFSAKTESEFWESVPSLGNNNRETSVMTDGEELFKVQCEKLSAALLVKDYFPEMDVVEWDVDAKAKVRWINKGELLAGSFIANDIVKSIFQSGFPVGDLDIYFKTRADAVEFCAINNMHEANFTAIDEERMCIRFTRSSLKFNLIWGVEYLSPKDLVSKFDIRASSMAYDPTASKLWTVNGAIHDASMKEIVFNPVPRATSIQRLVKYVEKGFTIGKYQRLFFSELIRSDIYSRDVELTTGYEVKSPR